MLEEQLSSLESEARRRIDSAQNNEELEAVRVEMLGRKGALAEASKQMAKLAPEQKASAGKLLNSVKQSLESVFEAKKKKYDEEIMARRLDAEWLDLTLPAPGIRPGNLHPITRIQREIEDLFTSMGFAVLDGPEVETEYHNFDALNIPADHPARDAQDTFWLTDGHLLRTHTSPVQIRGMKKLGPPLRMIAPGRVFRNEEVDASHEHTFYQLEGMMIDRNVSIANLIYFMKTMLSAVFRREVNVRLRPGFFPFVEPGFELDIQCLLCGGSGCPVCKQSGWVEQLGCGLVHPNVLRMAGIDPEEWNGFAFGLGLTRLVMMRYAIDDIRWLQSGDLRFARQF
jgi:phenylalanyl-tRNA synthetase alpha chain